MGNNNKLSYHESSLRLSPARCRRLVFQQQIYGPMGHYN